VTGMVVRTLQVSDIVVRYDDDSETVSPSFNDENRPRKNAMKPNDLA